MACQWHRAYRCALGLPVPVLTSSSTWRSLVHVKTSRHAAFSVLRVGAITAVPTSRPAAEKIDEPQSGMAHHRDGWMDNATNLASPWAGTRNGVKGRVGVWKALGPQPGTSDKGLEAQATGSVIGRTLGKGCTHTVAEGFEFEVGAENKVSEHTDPAHRTECKLCLRAGADEYVHCGALK
ncbi:hypothetical protein GGX14DRAFT_400525 [Mycena pura]|uniref:Uncharacterized protein n=1 Tax=Mycena pura TaxID=153505 RepID=A0AAD6V617_9AGAR|nr:hypothetical protein GGX14DRAFT_400525 [Mycena pura]